MRLRTPPFQDYGEALIMKPAAFRGTAAHVQRASGWGETEHALSQASASRVQLQAMPQAMGQAQYLETTDTQSPDPHCTLQLELSSFSEISRGQCLGLGWGEVAGSGAGPRLNKTILTTELSY